MKHVAEKARMAADILYPLPDDDLGNLLSAVCRKLSGQREMVLAQNQKDLQRARANDLPLLRLQRLTLAPAALDEALKQMQELAKQSDLVNTYVKEWMLPNNMAASQKRVPLGAIAAVYESRPTATLEIMALCLRTGNSCILRSGPEMLETNRAIADLARAAIAKYGLPETCVQLIEDCSEETLCRLMQCRSLDLLLARGGRRLIALVEENATIPWIRLGPGNCHVYVDAAADLEMAADIICTAKSQPLLCNSVETVLVHEKAAAGFIPRLAGLLSAKGIMLYGCPLSRQLSAEIRMIPEEKYAEEANDFVLKVKVVSDLAQAADHIKHFGSGHSEVIVTKDLSAAEQFTDRVDAGAVYVNASTRFTDGVSLGLGMEAGISTQKLHVRGPLTANALTTWKYVVHGCGNTR